MSSTLHPRLTNAIAASGPLGAATVLLLAAIAKTLRPEPLVLTSTLHVDEAWRWLLTLAEIGFASWLFSGVCSRLAVRWAKAVFVLFAGFALAKALRGDVSCGCFGAVVVSPWITLTADVLVVGWLRCWRFREGANTMNATAVQRLRPKLGLGLGVAIMTWSASVELSVRNVADTFSGQRVVVLNPLEWIHRPLPLMPFLDTPVDLRVGDWSLIFYHATCHDCLQRVGKYRELQRAGHIVFVGVPPLPEEDVFRRELGTGTFGLLRPEKEWFLRTPVVVHMSHGNVVAVDE